MNNLFNLAFLLVLLLPHPFHSHLPVAAALPEHVAERTNVGAGGVREHHEAEREEQGGERGTDAGHKTGEKRERALGNRALRVHQAAREREQHALAEAAGKGARQRHAPAEQLVARALAHAPEEAAGKQGRWREGDARE